MSQIGGYYTLEILVYSLFREKSSAEGDKFQCEIQK